MVKQNTGVSKCRTVEFQSTEACFQDNKTYRCRSQANAVGPYVTTEGLTTMCSAGVHNTLASLLLYVNTKTNKSLKYTANVNYKMY